MTTFRKMDKLTGFSLSYLPKDPGPCYSAEKKWYFNPKSGLCLRFIYGGCGGNGNRFDKKIDCKRMCGVLQLLTTNPACTCCNDVTSKTIWL
ncbi:unnamed protein product [Hydatigera taeniaeformis]|uniref:BPTI/Kunitz inhibitor domain-containing protein n=1 Tax=Hydatigena taeniaeformis TaxID=6205 RepID=A0A0R3X362_HYDTA|nr:unnamed protein product [Hydatigera taeniaeformis]